MSAPVLLNLLNELSKSDKIRGLPGMLSNSRTEFNKFNDTGRMLDFLYQITFKTLKNRLVDSKTLRFCHYLHIVMTDVFTLHY